MNKGKKYWEAVLTSGDSIEIKVDEKGYNIEIREVGRCTTVVWFASTEKLVKYLGEKLVLKGKEEAGISIMGKEVK